MNDLELMMQRYLDAPGDWTLYGAMIDLVMERDQVERPAAQLTVDIEQVAALHARHVPAATKELAPGAKYRKRLQRHIKWCAGLFQTQPCTILVVPGESLQCHQQARPKGTRCRYWPAATVIIGASRVLRFIESMKYEDAQVAADAARSAVFKEVTGR